MLNIDIDLILTIALIVFSLSAIIGLISRKKNAVVFFIFAAQPILFATYIVRNYLLR